MIPDPEKEQARGDHGQKVTDLTQGVVAEGSGPMLQPAAGDHFRSVGRYGIWIQVIHEIRTVHLTSPVGKKLGIGHPVHSVWVFILRSNVINAYRTVNFKDDGIIDNGPVADDRSLG